MEVKSVGTFPLILLKLALVTPPPTPNKVEFGAKWVKLSAFFCQNIARGSGGGGEGRRDEPKAEQNNCPWEQNPTELLLGRASSHSPKFFCPPLKIFSDHSFSLLL